MEQQELSLAAAGNGNDAATLEDSVAFSYKTLHTLTIHPAAALKSRSTQKPAQKPVVVLFLVAKT